MCFTESRYVFLVKKVIFLDPKTRIWRASPRGGPPPGGHLAISEIPGFFWSGKKRNFWPKNVDFWNFRHFVGSFFKILKI